MSFLSNNLHQTLTIAIKSGKRVNKAMQLTAKASFASLTTLFAAIDSGVRCQIWRCVCSQKIDSRKTVFGNS